MSNPSRRAGTTPRHLLLVMAAALCIAATTRPASAGAIAGYGFRAGVAASSIRGSFDALAGSESRLGFAGAMYCHFPLGRYFSIQPELGWASKGDEGALSFTYVPTGGPSVSPVTVGLPFQHRIDYVEIPVLLRIGAPNGSLFEPYLVVGPGVAFRTGSDMDTGVSPVTFGSQRVQPAAIFEQVGTFDSPRYRDVDWSAIGGGGLAWGRAPLRIVVDTRYALGLVGTFANTDRSFAHNGSWITTLGIELR